MILTFFKAIVNYLKCFSAGRLRELCFNIGSAIIFLVRTHYFSYCSRFLIMYSGKLMRRSHYQWSSPGASCGQLQIVFLEHCLLPGFLRYWIHWSRCNSIKMSYFKIFDRGISSYEELHFIVAQSWSDRVWHQRCWVVSQYSHSFFVSEALLKFVGYSAFEILSKFELMEIVPRK